MGDLLDSIDIYLILLVLLLCDELGLQEVVKKGAVKEAAIRLPNVMVNLVRAARGHCP